MKLYKGPCQRCGVPVVRNLRPGRPKLCLDCALDKSEHQNRTAHLPDAPGMAKSVAHNREFARQIADREGPLYEKWRAGQLRALGIESTEGAG